MSTPNITAAARVGAIALIGVLVYWYWATPPKSAKTEKIAKDAITTITAAKSTSTTDTDADIRSNDDKKKFPQEPISSQDNDEKTASAVTAVIEASTTTDADDKESSIQEDEQETITVVDRSITEVVSDVKVSEFAVTAEDLDHNQTKIITEPEQAPEPIDTVAVAAIVVPEPEVEATPTEHEEIITDRAETEMQPEEDECAVARTIVLEESVDSTSVFVTVEDKEETTIITSTTADVTVDELSAVDIISTVTESTVEVQTDEQSSYEEIQDVGTNQDEVTVIPETVVETEEEREIEEVEEEEEEEEQEEELPSEFDREEILELVFERQIPVRRQMIRTSTMTEDSEEVDQADTPTTLVGEELELTKDTLQTLQEVSRVAKHSELNARAQEFKPSWLNSSQQAPVSRTAPSPTPTKQQAAKIMSRCNYWPNCTNKACKYTHPSQPCRDADNCRFGDRCVFIHPKDLTPRSKKSKNQQTGHGGRPSLTTMSSASSIESWAKA